MIGPTEDSPLLLDRILHGHWVGRAREMAEAHALWQRVAHGEGRTLLISGEPGVGKTRFVRELASAVRLDGAGVLAGECYAEGSSPYSPLAQVIRDFFEGSPQAVKEIPEETLRDLLPILPSLSSQLIDSTPDRNLDLRADRQQVIEGFVAFCSTLSSRAPLLLFIDDVHWADADTLFLLRTLARRLRKLPVLIVMTYREAELESASLLKEVLLDLNHERLSLQLKLERLTRDESRDLLAAEVQLVQLAQQYRTEEAEAALAEARGHILLAEEHPLEAAEQWRQAISKWEKIERRYDQARALGYLGHALSAIGETAGARTAYHQASNIYDSLATQLDPHRRATFLDSPPLRDVRRAVEALSPARRRANGRPPFGALTEREVEVLKLVAQGLTNAQIAQQLVLSPLTVNAHLRSIYNKLDVTNRTAASHQAMELGLV